jgi:methylated-DNA-[protein]-cysteine S-methyltransferase
MKCVYFYEDRVLGMFSIVSDGERITNIVFGEKSALEASVLETPTIKKAAEEIFGYLGGRVRKFLTPIEVSGTNFQERVWRALLDIPFGETRSYGQVAKAVGCPRGCRAVGNANGRNKIPILIPCHRVIGNDGGIGGYSGGLAIKRRLLEVEGIVL